MKNVNFLHFVIPIFNILESSTDIFVLITAVHQYVHLLKYKV